MNDNKYRGQTLNFWELLKKHKIEIPIIQRDYAQGREDKEEIRNNFLQALYQSVENENPIKLDFIYGSMEGDAFQPLDGQQRLTTLFLLHWYALIKSQLLNMDNIGILEKFIYETRISSREFCNTLISKPPIVLNKTTILSTQIIDSSWFFLSWKKDPTIDAMLRTIDDIHKIFYEVEDLWEKITSQNLISFYHVELENIGLTDDLYIKMNARGKLLSPFENFKASFQKRINDEKWDENKKFTETFAYKIDSIWTDLFWSYRSEDNSIDTSFIKFIATVLMIRQSIGKKENRLSLIQTLQDKSTSVKPSLFLKDDFNYLCKCFSIYYNIFIKEIELKINCPLFQHKPTKDIFSAIIDKDSNASYSQKVLFYAQTEYLDNVTVFKKETFQDWMRVVRNIIARGDIAKTGKRQTIIRSQQTFDGVINLIHELSSGCSDIYTFLSTTEIKSSFAKEQIKEEKLKAKIIISNTSFKEIIFKLEDTNLLQGRIDFALYCINCDSIQTFNEDKLKKVYEVISTYLNEDIDINNDLRRALLTIANDKDEYNYYGYWWSFWNVVSANKRCLLDSNLRDLEFYIYGKNSIDYRIYIKNLILKLESKNLKEIVTNFKIPTTMPNWKKRLIQEPKLLNEQCKSNHIAIPKDESCCYLLKSLRPRDIDGCEEII